MAQFSSASVFSGGLNGPLFGIVDLDMALFGDQWKLFATDATESEISVLDVLNDDGPAVSGTAQAIAVGQFEVMGLDIVSNATSTFAVFNGQGTGGHNDYEIAIDGGLGSSFAFTPASGQSGGLSTISMATVGAVSMAATSQEGQSGFTVQSVSADLTPLSAQNVVVTGGDIADIELISLGASGLAVAIDRAGNEILSYTVASDGTVTHVDSLGVLDGLGLVSPDILRVVEIAGQSFGIVAAGSSSSVSVFEIADDGSMTARDHVIDGQGTRFASISELEVIEANGRAFVLTAGVDDGVTLLELLPDGRLIHHATIEDNDALSLQNISALTGEAQNGVLHIFATSETEAGLTELTFELTEMGQVAVGGLGDDTINGTTAGDVLFGGHGAGFDVLSGGEGEDILVAGQGADRLIGGTGADVFVFGDAREGGQIADFNSAEDLIDLSGWFQLHDTSQLSFLAYGDRVDITFGGYTMSVISHDGGTLTPADIMDRITINPSHSIITNVPDAADIDTTHFGSEGDDVLFGHAGQDVFIASGGADVMVGGDEFDVVSYENSDERIKADLLFSGKNRGEIADDRFYSIEGLTGSEFRDVLKGDFEQNWFEGGDGDDVIKGRAGNDELFGGVGNDRLEGGSDNDSLEGGIGDDLLKGNRGSDDLNGGNGNDTLRGGGGGDTLLGGAGDDILSGGGGADEFYFVEGSDQITDFSRNKDLLFISRDLLDDPTMSVEDILLTYGEDLGLSVRLDFGPDEFGDDQMITLNTVRNLDHLTDLLFVF